jgi:HD-like signal output (HDOD) protein
MLFSTPEGLIAQIKTLPSSPQIMQRMMLLLDDPNSTVESLVSVIQLERSLAARVVHLANSPIYNGGACGSIEEAVQRLGYAKVHEAVMTIMAIETFSRPLRVYQCPASVLWKQALATACAARELARRTSGDCNRAYTLGLLHNVGMVAIDCWVRQRQLAAVIECGSWPEEWQTNETRLLGYDHSEPSAVMMRIWGFPPSMVEAVKYQFRPAAAPESSTLAALLYAARWTRRQICIHETTCALPSAEIISLLGLKMTDMVEVVQKVSVELEMLSKALNLDRSTTAA